MTVPHGKTRWQMSWDEWLDSIRTAGFVPLPDEEIRPGDSYCAQRNTDLKLLTCQRVDRDYGFVVPVEPEYSFDTRECVKVTLP